MSSPNDAPLSASAAGAAEAPDPPAAGAKPVGQSGVLGSGRRFAEKHPMILAWVALSIGMVAILLYTSRDVGLLPSQLLAMVVATILLAAACVWIITWD